MTGKPTLDLRLLMRRIAVEYEMETQVKGISVSIPRRKRKNS